MLGCWFAEVLPHLSARPTTLVRTCQNSIAKIWVQLGCNKNSRGFLHLLGDSRAAPVGITLLYCDDRMNEFYARSFRAGLPSAFR